MDEKYIKQKVEENGHDFDEFLEDLKNKGQVPLKAKYPFFSSNSFMYLKGKFGFELNCRGTQLTRFNISPDNRWNIHLPKDWRNVIETERIREVIHQYLVNKGFDKNLGVKY